MLSEYTPISAVRVRNLQLYGQHTAFVVLGCDAFVPGDEETVTPLVSGLMVCSYIITLDLT